MPNSIYSAIFDGIDIPPKEIERYSLPRWAVVETDVGYGLCMNAKDYECHKFAYANSFYNRGYKYYEPFDNYYTSGVDFDGKTVGVIGHMEGIRRRHSSEYKKCYYFDFEPKDDEDLDPALEDEYLPLCDIVVITGSSIINGTLPHILELSRNAYTILVGPSVPQCPALLEFGIDRISGLIIETDKFRSYILGETHNHIYSYGHSFLISR